MKITITFKNIDPSDALQDYVKVKLARFEKQLVGTVNAHVVLSVQKLRHIVEVHFVSDRFDIQAKEETDNLYAAIDAVVDALKIRIQRERGRQRDKRPISKTGIKGLDPETDTPET